MNKTSSIEEAQATLGRAVLRAAGISEEEIKKNPHVGQERVKSPESQCDSISNTARDQAKVLLRRKIEKTLGRARYLQIVHDMLPEKLTHIQDEALFQLLDLIDYRL